MSQAATTTDPRIVTAGVTATSADPDPGRQTALTIPGLLMALDDASGFTPAQWTDGSGNGNHATQATPSKQGALSTQTYNGRRVVTFSGGQEYALPIGIGGIANRTICVVARIAGGAGVTDQCVALNGLNHYGSMSGTPQNWGTYNGTNRPTGYRADMMRCMMLRVGATAATLDTRTDGLPFTPVAGGLAAGGGCWLGSAGGLTFALHGDVAAVYVYDHALTTAEALQFEAWAKSRYGQMLIVTDGNSLVQGHIAPSTTAPIDFMSALLPFSAYFYNLGHAGFTTRDMTAQDPGLFDILLYPNTPIVWIGMEGRNDLAANQTLQQAYDDIVANVAARKAAAVAAGATRAKFLWATFPPSTTTLNLTEANRQALRAMLKAHPPPGCDLIVDVAADLQIGQAGQNLNTVFFNADQIHLTAAGDQVLARIYSSAIVSLGAF